MRQTKTRDGALQRIAGCLASLGLMAASAGASAAMFDVTIDTSGISGQAVTMEFVLDDGNDGINSATISNFATDGMLAAMGLPSSMAVTGTLAGPVTVPELEAYQHDITLGDSIFFKVTITENWTADPLGPPTIPDGLSFYLLDAGGIPLFFTDDPTFSDALFAILVDEDGVDPQPYSPFGDIDMTGMLVDPVSGVSVTIVPTPTSAPLPEPPLLALLAAATLLAGARRGPRKGPQEGQIRRG